MQTHRLEQWSLACEYDMTCTALTTHMKLTHLDIFVVRTKGKCQQLFLASRPVKYICLSTTHTMVLVRPSSQCESIESPSPVLV